MTEIEECYEQMYEFENNSKLYDFCFKDTGIPMWMYIRSYFIREVADRKTSYQISQMNVGRKGHKIKKKFIHKYITKNPFCSRKKDILYAFWNYNGLKQQDNGLVYESLIMPFLQIFPDCTTTLMDGAILNKYELDCAYPNWKMDDIFLDILNYRSKIRINKNICDEDKNSIRELLLFLTHNCPLRIDSGIKKRFSSRLEYFSQNSKLMIKVCEVYLQIVKPKVAVICCASYPDLLTTSLILACKNKKVKTAELQHGLTSRCHSFYQYCDYILTNNKCKRMLPDYYLAFSEYWKNQVKIPQKYYVNGYAKPVVKDDVPLNNKILFCADLDFDEYLNFLDKLMPNLDKNTSIYFRFHPRYLSKKFRNQFEKYLKYPNFFIANEKDISFYLKECRFVIVGGSTVCYEALFMGRIVFSFVNEQNNWAGIGKLDSVHLFKDAEEFMDLWDTRDTLKSEYHNEFFDLNYKNNYISFLRKCGVKSMIYK